MKKLIKVCEFIANQDHKEEILSKFENGNYMMYEVGMFEDGSTQVMVLKEDSGSNNGSTEG